MRWNGRLTRTGYDFQSGSLIVKAAPYILTSFSIVLHVSVLSVDCNVLEVRYGCCSVWFETCCGMDAVHWS